MSRQIEMELPVKTSGDKIQWDRYGIQWVRDLPSAPSFLEMARLPAGWSVKSNEDVDFDKRDFVLIDAQGLPKVTVWLKVASYDKYARVNFLSDSESEALKAKYSTSAVDDQLARLLGRYRHSINFTAGCGARGQHTIDSAWDDLQAFAAEHPEFASRIPDTKYICRDDGTGGMASGLSAGCAQGMQ